VAHLDLKVILHRGHSVRQSVGVSSDLLGPAVTVAHRLLKNTIRDEIGYRPYLFLTEPAASALGLPDVGSAHGETYADAGTIEGRVLELGEPTPRLRSLRGVGSSTQGQVRERRPTTRGGRR
jgi:hypothetical protein